jgi:hypothetical protein
VVVVAGCFPTVSPLFPGFFLRHTGCQQYPGYGIVTGLPFTLSDCGSVPEDPGSYDFGYCYTLFGCCLFKGFVFRWVKNHSILNVTVLFPSDFGCTGFCCTVCCGCHCFGVV